MKDGMPLGEALRSAYSPERGCPSPEIFLSWETGDLPVAERRRLEEHVAHCPACAAERDLARLFEASPEEMESRREDMGFLLARLEASRPGRPAEAKVIPIDPRRSRQQPVATEAPAVPAAPPVRRRSGFRPAWSLAAAAMLAVVCGVLFQMRSAPPPLPDPGTSGVMRGTDLALVYPLGELSAAPSELRWEEIAGARSYRWRLISVDGTVVWEETATGSPVRLPGGLVRALHPAVVYTWTVEALDDRLHRIASAEPVRFRVRPSGEEESASPSPQGGG
jgi:hypothetical protein